MKKRIVALLLALTLILALSACGGKKPEANDSGPAPSESATPDLDFAEEGEDATGSASTEKPDGIQPGTVFNYWINYDLPNHLPWADNRASMMYFQIYDNLLYKYHADSNDIRGNLAESWEVSDDGLTWVFQIRKDATFSSGNPVTAEAFVKTWDYTKEYQPRYFAPVESYEATGEYELTIKLKSNSPTFIYDLPMQPQCGPLDPEALEQYGPEDNRAAVGCGPYYIAEHISGEKIVLKANANYNHPERKPCIETVNMVIIPDENTAMIALMNGEIDTMTTVNIEVYNTLKDAGWDIKLVTDRVNPFWFNAREVELFRDKTVREALCHMIDWQALSELVYDGLFPAPNSFWVGPGESPYKDNYKYDPELGIKMLEEAGYSKDDIKFTMLADPDFTNLEVAIQAQFQELGFNNIDTVTYDGATCYGMLKSGTYEMFPVHNGYGHENPLTCYTMGLLPNGTQRCMWLEYCNEEKYEEALKYWEEANSAPDWDTYVKAVEKITEICQDENLALGGLQVMRMYAFNDRFAGIYIMPIVCYYNFCDMWDTQA